MIRKPLSCPTCGDTWKRVFNESFTRLGPATHECRACWTIFQTGAKEWKDLDRIGKVSYFLQDLVLIAPLAGLLLLAMPAGYMINMIDPSDMPHSLLMGGLFLLGLYVLLTLVSLFRVWQSLRRVRRSRRKNEMAARA